MVNGEQKCNNCRYWLVEQQATEHTVAVGECRRRSPRIVLSQIPWLHNDYCSVHGEQPHEADRDELSQDATTAVWPQTRDYNWCGEWQGEASAGQPLPEMMDDYGVHEWLGISSRAVLKMARAGQIPSVVLPDGNIAFRRDELANWVASLPRPSSES